jgi:hypothetical protein
MRLNVKFFRCELCGQTFSFPAVPPDAITRHVGCPLIIVTMLSGKTGLFGLSNIAAIEWPELKPITFYGPGAYTEHP